MLDSPETIRAVKASREIRSLTGLRGIAALFVVELHFMRIDNTAAEPGWSVRQFIGHGYLSVDLFFVLSGFVMALTYGQSFRANQPGIYVRFLGHRLARIYPLYFAITLFAAAIHFFGLMHAQPVPDFLQAFAANLLMIQSWGMAQSLVWPAWSISTEWAAYLLFPLLLAVTLRPRPRLAAWTAVACLALIVLLAYGEFWNIPFPARTGPLDLWRHESAAPVLRCIAGFSTGLLTFRLFRACSIPGSAALIQLCPLVSLFVLTLCCLPGTDVVIVGLFPLLILGLAWDKGVVARILGSWPFHSLGVLSYSIYIIHQYFTHGVDLGENLLSRSHPQSARLLATLSATLLVMAAAALVFHAVERPSRLIVRRIFDRSSLRSFVVT